MHESSFIKGQAIEAHVAGHTSFEYWVTAIKYADWETPEDIQQTFGPADLLGGGYDRVVFDIGGNNYRLICKYHFGNTKVHLFVCRIGSHAAYDELYGHGGQYTAFEY